MNPADTETNLENASGVSTVNATLTSQGTLLGQHQQISKALTESNQAMCNQISRLTNQVANLTIQLTQPTATQPAPSPQPLPDPVPSPSSGSASPLHEPFVSEPEQYNGDLGSCRAFFTQGSLVFEHQHLSYATDRSRIAYLINCMMEFACAW